MTRPFAITRTDGRSNTAVVLDLVRGDDPGRLYSYDEIAAALHAGTVRVYDRRATQAAVRTASGALLKQQQRALRNVANVGYRLAFANEHQPLAIARKQRADAQMRHGMSLLEHVRIDELDENARRVHEGTLLIVGAIYQQQRAMDKRLRVVEEAIKKIAPQGEA